MCDKKRDMMFAPRPTRERRARKVCPEQDKPDIEPRSPVNISACHFRIEFRCESGTRLYLRGSVVQYLACPALGKPYVLCALSLAVAQTSCRVSYHTSRYHYTPDRIAYWENLGNRRNHDDLQRRTAS